jgi:hypothetical protein
MGAGHIRYGAHGEKVCVCRQRLRRQGGGNNGKQHFLARARIGHASTLLQAQTHAFSSRMKRSIDGKKNAKSDI